MNGLEKTIEAELLHKGKIEFPNVQPGMIISNKLSEGIKFDITKLTSGRTSLKITPDVVYQRVKQYLPE